MIKIRHTGLVTYNLKKSLNFWNKILKFKITKDIQEDGDLIDKIMFYQNVKLRTIKLKDSYSNLIEIIFFKNLPKKDKKDILPYSEGFTHISVTVKNISLTYKKLKKNGTRFNSIPQKAKDGKVLMTYCRTPEGAFLELVEEVK